MHWVKNKWPILGYIVLIIFILAIIWAAYLRFAKGYVWANWTGFEETTLWDWLVILIGTSFAAMIAYYNQSNATRKEALERELLRDRQREEGLQIYLDKMTELLLQKGLGITKIDSVVRSVARARTLTTLGTLDGIRKGSLIRFLYESNLIIKTASRVALDGANLSNADLSNANLIDADLRGTDLSYANLSYANLSFALLLDADLSRADLSGVDLSSATLTNADLSGVDLRGAILTGANLKYAIIIYANLRNADLSFADLSYADLRYADLTKADLRKADLRFARVADEQIAQSKSLEGAIMPDGRVHE